MIGAKAYLYRKWGSYRFALSVALGLVGAIIIALFGYLFSSQSGLNQGALRTTRSGTGPSSTRVTTEDQRVLFNAEQILIGNCMRQHNFKYLPIPFSPPSQPGNPSPYYITSRAWAERNGFGGSDPSSSQALDPNQQYYASLTPARKQSVPDRYDGHVRRPAPGPRQDTPGRDHGSRAVRLPGYRGHEAIRQLPSLVCGIHDYREPPANTNRTGNKQSGRTAKVL